MQGYIERAFAGRHGRPTSGASAAHRASCAGCASRCSPIARSAGASAAPSSCVNDIEDDVRVRDALKSQQVAAAPFRRQHSGPDRVSRQEPALHVRQPGVRELGVQAAGRDLRQDAVRGDGLRRRRVPAAGAEARAGRRARRVRAHRPERARPAALDARPHRARPRFDAATCAACIAPNTTSTT